MEAAIVNIRSFSHPHVISIYSEGLWGFPDNEINRKRWHALKPDIPVFLYGEHGGTRGIWALCRLVSKESASGPVRYWKPPDGYPLLIHLECILPQELKSEDDLKNVSPITKEELASAFSISAFRQKADRWSLYVFGKEKSEGITYPISKFEAVKMEFESRNTVVRRIDRPDHEQLKRVICEIGKMQGKYTYTEYQIEDKKLDVVWKRLPKENAVPYIAWEVSLGGDLFADLTKLKHAYDVWNSIPVLVTTDERIQDVRAWVEGSFHEIKDVLRIISWRKIKELYEKKGDVKRLEKELGII